MKQLFRVIASRISAFTGTGLAFALAFSIVFVWAISGPMFNFSSTWQLFINTGTTIVTFLMVFLIQNTQNRDTKAIQLKLDELLNSSKTARQSFIDLEDLTDNDLDVLDKEFKRIHDQYAQSPDLKIHKLHTKIVDLRRERTQKL
jgi:low affinity Fe/Cu permease